MLATALDSHPDVKVADEVFYSGLRDFQRLLDLKLRRKSSQLPVCFPDPKTNFSSAGENYRKYRLIEDGIWNTGSN